jgi:hypothetical protein
MRLDTITGFKTARLRKHAISATVLAISLLLCACDPVSLTMLGVGAGAGVAHEMGGIAYKTFTEPLPRVKKAALKALDRMAVKVSGVEKTASGEVIKATAADRNIEVELEALTANTTRIRTVARRSTFLVDSSTAVEIIVQTEKALGA